MTRAFLSFLAVAIFSLSTSAQQMTINGVPGTARVAPGATITLDLTAPSGSQVWLALSAGPGPSNLGGLSLPIDLQNGFALLANGVPVAPSGSLSLSAALPADPGLTGATFYLAAVIASPTFPSGVAVANAAAFEILSVGADAGPDTAALVGGFATLDGSHSSNPVLPQWTVQVAPAGSSATIERANSLTPTLRPDRAGTYILELQTGGGGAISADQVRVDAWELSITSPTEGQFLSSNPLLTGTMRGPAGAPLSFDGTPVIPDLLGNWSTATGALSDGPHALTVTLNAPGGEVLQRTRSVVRGIGIPLSVTLPSGLFARAQPGAFDALEGPLETEVANFDIQGALTSLPTTTIVDNFAFSARYRFTSATFSPNPSIDLTTRDGHIDATFTLRNVRAVARVTGDIFGIGYTENATITATAAVITGDLMLSPNPQGGIMVTLTNGNVSLTGFNFSVGGVLNGVAQLGLIQDAIRDAVESALEGFLPVIPQELNPLLSGFSLSADLSASGIPMRIDSPVRSVAETASGVTFTNAFQAQATGSTPTAPAITHSLFTANPLPAFNSTTPFTGAPYDIGLVLEDDALNRILAVLTQAGMFEVDIDVTGGPLGMPLTVQSASFLLPNSGFESFAPSLSVVGRLTSTMAPIVSLMPGTMDQGRLRFEGLRLELGVLHAGGQVTPVVDIGLSFGADVDFSLASDLSQISLDASNFALSGTVRGAMAGSNLPFLVANLNPLANILLPPLLTALQGLPLPALGLSGTVLETSVTPANPNQLGAWVDLP